MATPPNTPYPAGPGYQQFPPTPPQYQQYPAQQYPGQQAAAQPAPGQPRRLSAGLLLGMHAALWSVTLIVLLAPYHALDNWVIDAYVAGHQYPYVRSALVDWLHFTMPFLVGGAVALAFLRPKLWRVLVGLGCAVLTLVIELSLVPALAKADIGGSKLLDVVFAVSLAVATFGWLIVRGRSGPRLAVALATVPLAWLLLYGEQKLWQNHQLQKVFDWHYYYVVIALVIFVCVTIALAVPALLASIGGRPAFAGPPGVGPAAAPPPPPAPWGAAPPQPPQWGSPTPAPAPAGSAAGQWGAAQPPQWGSPTPASSPPSQWGSVPPQPGAQQPGQWGAAPGASDPWGSPAPDSPWGGPR